MTNCDLDELKHQALQKFIEMADSKWSATRRSTSVGFQLGKYFLDYDRFRDGVWIYLGDTHIYMNTPPHLRTTKYGKNLEAVPLDEEEQTAADEEYKADLEKYEADPVVVAAKKIYGHWHTAECKAKEEQMKKDMEESCKRLQKEMSAIDKSNERAEIAASSCLTVDRPWWRRWWE